MKYQILVGFEESTLRDLKDLAKKLGVSRSSLIRTLVEEGLKNQENKDKEGGKV